MLLHKAIDFETKSLQEDGTFEGWAARFGNLDRQGDIIDPAAFAGHDGKEVTILDNHKADLAVGTGVIEVKTEGLWIKAKLLTTTRAGAEAYEKLKARVARGLSVGIRLLESVKDGAARRITRGEVAEVSITSFPANPEALVTSVKSESPYAALLPYL